MFTATLSAKSITGIESQLLPATTCNEAILGTKMRLRWAIMANESHRHKNKNVNRSLHISSTKEREKQLGKTKNRQAQRIVRLAETYLGGLLRPIWPVCVGTMHHRMQSRAPSNEVYSPLMAATPGNTLPSMASSIAPPPVET